MKSEKDKVVKIMNELVCFFFSLNIHNPRIAIDMLDSHSQICVEGAYENPNYKKLNRFSELVNIARQDDYVEYYWNLAGNSKYPELILLGSLVDSSHTEYKDGVLKITLIRNR